MASCFIPNVNFGQKHTIFVYAKSQFTPRMFAKAIKTVAVTVLIMTSQASMHLAAEAGGFDKQLEHARQLIQNTGDSLNHILAEIGRYPGLTDIQKARINMIRLKLQTLEEMHYSFLQSALIPSTDYFSGSQMEAAQNFIIQSRPDEGIALIMQFLEDADISSDTAIFARIYLAEAYRQKREYDKGISMLYEILGNNNLSAKNRAFALNRMAALQSEKEPFEGNKKDSIRKYSRLCIDVSEKYNLQLYLALSKNELGYNYFHHNLKDTALLLISEAAQIFLDIQKMPQAINSYLNLSYIYGSMGRYEEAKNILLEALELGSIEENRNLFRYVYYHLSNISYSLGDLNAALEYLHIAHKLMIQFYDDRIQLQINEMSARFDLQEKEAKIREEKQKSRAYRLRLQYFLVISLISVSLLAVLVILFRFKNKAYKKLVEQTLKAMKREKQVELCLKNLSESDIMAKLAAEDRNAELALRLEKFMAEEKPYLWSDVSLEEFCKKLNTNRSYLSKLIKDKYHLGFYDLLFEYRVRAAIEFLNSPQSSHLSVEAIGEMAGFKSNSNFYKRFKNVVGLTPHQFREMAEKFEKLPSA